jgi:hypothetical protein
MNALDRWKIVLTLIAIFVAGAVTGRVAHDPRGKIRDAATERAATGNAFCGGSRAHTLASGQ